MCHARPLCISRLHSVAGAALLHPPAARVLIFRGAASRRAPLRSEEVASFAQLTVVQPRLLTAGVSQPQHPPQSSCQKHKNRWSVNTPRPPAQYSCIASDRADRTTLEATHSLGGMPGPRSWRRAVDCPRGRFHFFHRVDLCVCVCVLDTTTPCHSQYDTFGVLDTTTPATHNTTRSVTAHAQSAGLRRQVRGAESARGAERALDCHRRGG